MQLYDLYSIMRNSYLYGYCILGKMKITMRLNPKIVNIIGCCYITHQGMGISVQGSSEHIAMKMFLKAAEMVICKTYNI